MKSNSSPNDIPSKVLKIVSCIVSEWLSKFYNKCMTTGEFPDSWKFAHITPIPKVHSSSSSSEYRPISVLPVLPKLFENVLYHRVYSYLTEHNLIDKRQYGFRENHSIDLAITTIYDELLRNLDNKLITCSLFLDLSKAFDCCDHEILLDKLYHDGIRGVSHKVLSNFLHNRMQCTKIGAFKSSYKRISCGVPQSSVISPLLFLIYINDITKASSFDTTLFADDIKLPYKAIKIVNPTNTGSLEEHFQHLNILCLPKLYTISAGLWSRSRGVGVGRIFNLRSRSRRIF